MSKFPKYPVGLFPPIAILEGADAMASGVEKHGGMYNWRDKPESACNLIDGAIRHLLALRDGESMAEDGKSHAGHVLARIGILVDAAAFGNLIDDRPRANQATGKAICNWEEREKDPLNNL